MTLIDASYCVLATQSRVHSPSIPINSPHSEHISHPFHVHLFVHAAPFFLHQLGHIFGGAVVGAAVVGAAVVLGAGVLVSAGVGA